MFHNTEKTETRHEKYHKSYSTPELQRPIVEWSWLCFSLHKLFIVSRVDLCGRVRLNVRISLLKKESATGSTLRSHKQSMEHQDAMITFRRRCN